MVRIESHRAFHAVRTMINYFSAKRQCGALKTIILSSICQPLSQEFRFMHSTPLFAKAKHGWIEDRYLLKSLDCEDSEEEIGLISSGICYSRFPLWENLTWIQYLFFFFFLQEYACSDFSQYSDFTEHKSNTSSSTPDTGEACLPPTPVHYWGSFPQNTAKGLA